MVTRTHTNTPPANRLDYQPPTAGAAQSNLETYLDALETRLEALEGLNIQTTLDDHEQRITAIEGELEG